MVWLEAGQLGVRGWRLGGQGEVSARRTDPLDGSLRGFKTVNRSPFHDEWRALSLDVSALTFGGTRLGGPQSSPTQHGGGRNQSVASAVRPSVVGVGLAEAKVDDASSLQLDERRQSGAELSDVRQQAGSQVLRQGSNVSRCRIQVGQAG